MVNTEYYVIKRKKRKRRINILTVGTRPVACESNLQTVTVFGTQ